MVSTRRDVRDDTAEAEARRGSAARRTYHRGGHYRAGIFQRFAKTGDKRRRQDSGPRREAHHQRANGGGSRVRVQQKEERKNSRIRLWRWNVRYFGPRSGG